MAEKSTRKIAIEKGEMTYYTGKPCKHGHDSPHYVTGGGCVQCGKARTIAERKATKEAIRKARAKNGS